MTKTLSIIGIVLAVAVGAGCSTDNGELGSGGAGGTGGAAGTGGAGGSGAVAGSGGMGGVPITCTTPSEILNCDGAVLNIAHRGGRRIRPEHTLLAYEQALIDGSDILELDLHATSDGVIVVMHDDTINRTTDGEGAIKEMTFDELRTYDAGYDFTPDGGETYPYRGTGLVVPTLVEVLDEFPGVPFVIEIKQGEPSIVDDFVAIVRDYDVVSQLNGAAFDVNVLTELRAAAPEMKTSFGETEVVEFYALSLNENGIDPEYVPPAEFLQVPPRRGELDVLHDRFIPTAHELGLKVHVWTINDPEEMRQLIEMGVDGIMTDLPPTLTEIIEETGTGIPSSEP